MARKYETVDLKLDGESLRMLKQIAKWTHHPKETVLEVLLALWMFQEKNREPRDK